MSVESLGEYLCRDSVPPEMFPQGVRLSLCIEIYPRPPAERYEKTDYWYLPLPMSYLIEGPSLWYTVHYKIRWPDGIVAIHHELVVVQPRTNFCYDLVLYQYLAGWLSLTLTES